MNIQKKVIENEALQRTLIQNEENKRLQAIAKEQQRLEDIKSAEEYTKVLEKQENERKAYFKNIENKSNNFLSKVGKTILKEVEENNRLEEEKMAKYLKEKEERAVQKEKEKQEEIRIKKKEMRAFLDKQVEQKKLKKEFEKYIDSAQAGIWTKDKEVEKAQEQEVHEKIKTMNNFNLNILKNQLDQAKAKNAVGMTDLEYLMNKDLVEKAAKKLNN